MLKKTLSILLVLCMMFSMVPAGLAADLDIADEPELIPIVEAPPVEQGGMEWHLNPLYKGLVSEERIVEELNAIQPTDDVTTDCSTFEELVQGLRDGMKARLSSITLHYTGSGSFDAYTIVANAFSHTGVPTEGDYLMWVYAGWGVSVSGGDYTFSFAYYTDAAQEAELDAAVDALLTELDLAGETPIRKVQAVYDYICDNIVYDYEHLEEEDYMLMYTAYAALVNKTAVCQGYAVLLYRLMLTLGVDCRVVTSITHAWNIIGLDGLYYNVDSTWDAGTKRFYLWFLKSMDHFPNEHHVREKPYSDQAFYDEYPMSESDYDLNKGLLTLDQSEFALVKGGDPVVVHYTIDESLSGCAVSYSRQEWDYVNIAWVENGLKITPVKNGREGIMLYLVDAETGEPCDMAPVYVTVGEPEGDELPLTEDYFPDANFRARVKELFDKDNSGGLSDEEIENAKELSFSSLNIASIAGVEYLTKLNVLECTNFFEMGLLTEVDLSRNTWLREVYLGFNPIETLDVTALPLLNTLMVGYTRLSALDLSNNPLLKKLWIDNSRFTSIDLSNKRFLDHLDAYGNEGMTELDISGCPLLVTDYQAGGRKVEKFREPDPNLYNTLIVYGGSNDDDYTLAVGTWMTVKDGSEPSTLPAPEYLTVGGVRYRLSRGLIYGDEEFDRRVVVARSGSKYYALDVVDGSVRATALTETEDGLSGSVAVYNSRMELSDGRKIYIRQLSEDSTAGELVFGTPSEEHQAYWVDYEDGLVHRQYCCDYQPGVSKPYGNWLWFLTFRNNAFGCSERGLEYDVQFNGFCPEDTETYLYILVCEHENMVAVPAVEPDCLHFGHSLYYECPDCGLKVDPSGEIYTKHIEGEYEFWDLYSLQDFYTGPALGHDYDSETGVCTRCGEAAPVYEKVTDQSGLVEGRRYLLVDDATGLALELPRGGSWAEADCVAIETKALADGKLTVYGSGGAAFRLTMESPYLPYDDTLYGYPAEIEGGFSLTEDYSWQYDHPLSWHVLAFARDNLDTIEFYDEELDDYVELPEVALATGLWFEFLSNGDVAAHFYDGMHPIVYDPELGFRLRDEWITDEEWDEETGDYVEIELPTGVSLYGEVTGDPVHTHSYGEPVWAWADDYSSATATFTCAGCGDVQTLNAGVTSEKNDPGCETDGKIVYTATVSFNGTDYTDTKEVVLPAQGHSYGEPVWVWADDYSSATAAFTCAGCGDVQTLNAGVTSEKNDPGCETDGKIVYTATVSFNGTDYTDTKEEVLPAQGHSYGEPVWVWAVDYSAASAAFTCGVCGITEYYDAEVTIERTEPTTEAEGRIVYTATVVVEQKTYTDVQTVILPKLPDPQLEAPVLSLDGMSTKGVALRWTAVEGASSYAVMTTVNGEAGPVRAAMEPYFLDEYAAMGMTYVYTVMAIVNGNWSEASNEVEVFFNPFSDVEGKKTTEYVAWAFNNGIVTGTSTTTFTPNDPCTRVQFIMMLWKMHGSPVVDGVNPFSDVSGNKTTKAILWALDAGVINYADTFDPNGNISRVQIVMILWKLAGSPEVTGENPFIDVSGKKTTKAVLWAYQQGITKGTSATTFAPNADCTRVQLVVFLYKYNGIYHVI